MHVICAWLSSKVIAASWRATGHQTQLILDQSLDTSLRYKVEQYVGITKGSQLQLCRPQKLNTWPSVQQPKKPFSSEVSLLNLKSCKKNLKLYSVTKKGVIERGKNAPFSSRTKHINTKHDLIKELIHSGRIDIQFLAPNLTLADILIQGSFSTKAVKIHCVYRTFISYIFCFLVNKKKYI